MSVLWSKGKTLQSVVVPRGPNLQSLMRARTSAAPVPRITHVPDSTYWVPAGQAQGSVALVEQGSRAAWPSAPEAKRPRAVNCVNSFIVEMTRECLDAQSNPAREEPVPEAYLLVFMLQHPYVFAKSSAEVTGRKGLRSYYF